MLKNLLKYGLFKCKNQGQPEKIFCYGCDKLVKTIDCKYHQRKECVKCHSSNLKRVLTGWFPTHINKIRVRRPPASA